MKIFSFLFLFTLSQFAFTTNDQSTSYLEKIVLGSLISGLGFGNCSTTLGHALSYVFSNEGYSHGHALSFTPLHVSMHFM